MNDKAVIEFGFRKIWRVLQISEPSASVDNTFLDLQNSSYPTQPHSIIAKYSSRLIILINSNWVESEIVFTFYIVRSVRSPEIEAKFEFYFNWFQLEKKNCFV